MATTRAARRSPLHWLVGRQTKPSCSCFLFHVPSLPFPAFFSAFVRPFKADDKVIRPFNAHRTLQLRRATDIELNGGPLTFPNQPSRGGLRLDELRTPNSSFLELQLFPAMPESRNVPALGDAFSVLTFGTSETNSEAHFLLSSTHIQFPIDCETIH